MFKVLKYLGSSVLALAVIVLILPYFVSLNAYKGEISKKAKEAIGRDLVVAGDIKFSILPRPYLRLKEIKLSSAPQAQEPTMVSIKEVEVILSILPLFSGKIEVSKVVLDSPVISLEKLKNGKGNWEFDLPKPTESAPKSAESPLEMPKDSPFHIKRIKIKEGVFRYIDGKDKMELKDINLSLYAENLQGPIDFDLELKMLDEAIDIKGSIKKIGPQIPVEAKVKAFGKKLIVGGIIDLEAQGFKGDLELKGSLSMLKKMMPHLSVPKPLMEKYRLTADVSASADKISIDKIDFNLKPLQAQGRLDFDLKKNTGSVVLDLMPGEIHLALKPDAPQNGQFSGAVSLKAKKVMQLLAALKVPTKDIPPFMLKAFSFATHVTYKDQKIALKNIDLDVGKAKLDGQLILQDWSKKGRYTFDLRTQNLAALAALMDMKLSPSLGPAKFKGTLIGKPEDLKVDLSVYALNAQTQIQGLVRQKEKAIKPELSVAVSGTSLQSTLRHLGQESPSKSLGNFKINAQVSGDIPQRIKLVLQKSYIKVGKDKLGLDGNIDVFLSGSKPKITADISLSDLNLDRLMAAFDGAPSGSSNIHLVAKSSRSKSQPKARWSHEKIDLSALNGFDGDVKIAIPSVRKGSLVFDSMKVNMRIANGVLDLNSLKGNLYGGLLIVKARASSQKDQAITLTAHLKDAKLKNIVPKQKEIKVVKGLFSLDADLSTSGHSEHQFVSNLAGSMNFKGTEGAISGFDLQRVVNNLSNMKDLGAALKLLDQSFSGGETAFNSIDCVTSISKGEARIKKFLLDAVGANVTADGSVNLLKYWMDIQANIALEGKDLPPFSAHIFGPMDNPNHKLNTAKLEQYLLQNVLTGVMDAVSQGKGKPEDILKGIFGLGGKNKAPQQTPSTAPPQQQTQPKTQQQQEADAIGKAVGSLLKDLF